MRWYGKRSAVMAMVLVWAMMPALGQQDAASTRDLSIDFFNLEANTPFRVEDASVLPEYVWETHASIRWGEGCPHNWLEGNLGIAYGLSDRSEAMMGIIYRNNDQDSTGDGDVYLRFLRQVRRSGNSSLLLGGELNLPTGQDYARQDHSAPPYVLPVYERSNDIDSSLMCVFTEMLDAQKRERVHMEVKYSCLPSSPVGFASNRWFAGTTYERRLSANTQGLASIWWEEAVNPCLDSSTALQVGVRHQESERLVWGASLDLGLDWQQADWGLTLAGQYRR